MAEAHNTNRKESDKKYRTTNRPKITAKMREYRARNPGKDYEHTRKWESSNPDKARIRKIKNYLITRATKGFEMRRIKADAETSKAYAGSEVQILAEKTAPGVVAALTHDSVRILVPVSEIEYP